MKSVTHSSYLILMAFLSIIDPSTAGCDDGLENKRWVMFKDESLSLVLAGDLKGSMNCTMKYYEINKWPTHLRTNENWTNLMDPFMLCNIIPTNKPECEENPIKVPLFYFRCFMGKAMDLDLEGCGDYENLRSIYLRMPLQNSTGGNCTDPFNPEKRATHKNDEGVLVLKTLVVVFGISTIVGPVLMWLYMRQKVKMYTEQEVQEDTLL